MNFTNVFLLFFFFYGREKTPRFSSHESTFSGVILCEVLGELRAGAYIFFFHIHLLGWYFYIGPLPLLAVLSICMYVRKWTCDVTRLLCLSCNINRATGWIGEKVRCKSYAIDICARTYHHLNEAIQYRLKFSHFAKSPPEMLRPPRGEHRFIYRLPGGWGRVLISSITPKSRIKKKEKKTLLKLFIRTFYLLYIKDIFVLIKIIIFIVTARLVKV